MINVILNGACGRLGTTFQKVAKETTAFSAAKCSSLPAKLKSSIKIMNFNGFSAV